jgi:hypothetical protein
MVEHRRKQLFDFENVGTKIDLTASATGSCGAGTRETVMPLAIYDAKRIFKGMTVLEVIVVILTINMTLPCSSMTITFVFSKRRNVC